jgi:hypothetical protein
VLFFQQFKYYSIFGVGFVFLIVATGAFLHKYSFFHGHAVCEKKQAVFKKI